MGGPLDRDFRLDEPFDERETALVLAELEQTPVEYPERKELVLRGRAAMVGRDYDPDDVVPAEVDDMFREGIPAKTLEVYEYQWGRFIHWCGSVGREHKPPTVATMRFYIWSHWSARRPDGRGRGRYGQPYAPATVKTAIYSVSTVLQWMNQPTPMKHPYIKRQLRGYRKRWEAAGYRPDRSAAISHEDSVRMARSCNLATVQGLRMAAMCRVHNDMGARAGELLNLRRGDITWVEAGAAPVVRVWVSRSKTDQDAEGRAVFIEATPDVDGDVDPAILLTRWMDARFADRPDDEGHVFTEVIPSPPNAHWPGEITDKPLPLRAYEKAHDRCAARAGVDVDPHSKRRRKVTSHGNRRGLIIGGRDAGLYAEQVGHRTGHKKGSRTLHEYWEGGDQRGDENAGTRIRLARARTAEGSG
jgi:integrase